MALNFKNDEVDRLARRLAATTGESLTEAVRKSLEERLQREKVKREDRSKLKEELRAIRRRIAALPDLDHRSAEEILGYDEFGLPR